MPRWRLLWYAAQISADEKDELEYHKGLIEYLATLISAEGADRVEQVLGKERRGGQDKTKVDNEFDQTLSEIFGRTPQFSQRNNPSGENSRIHLSDRDLDTVKIIRKNARK